MRTNLFLLALLVTLVSTKENDLPWQNVCNNGHDPSKNSKKFILEQFAKGPCAPIILLPGIGGSDLQMQIDCPKFRAAHPDVFKTCGWNSCDGESQSENSSSPKPEYQIWVPHIISPMTLFSPFEKNKECFVGLASVEYVEVGNKLKVKAKTGITISPLGTTPETRQKHVADCGMDGVINIIPDIINPEDTTYYIKVKERLEQMGYVSGLTMQAVPFDFRIDNDNDPNLAAMPKIMKSLFHLVNKKIVLLGHSMGNHRMVNFLWNTSQADKDKYLHHYVAAAPVLLGAVEVNKYFICGSTEYSFVAHLGIDFPTFKGTLGEFSSMFQLLPNDCYRSQRDLPWMKKILARIEYEKGNSDDPVFDWMPKREEKCYSKYPKNDKCISGLFDYTNFGEILGEPITVDNLRDVIDEYTFSTLKKQGWNVIQDNFRQLPSLGLPTSLVYSTRVPSEGGHHFDKDPRQFTSKNEFCGQKNFEFIYVPGDETVPSTSATTPFIKWAWEFEQGTEGSHPVKFVDVCSDKNQRFTPYDKEDDKGMKISTKNEYQGIPCNCTEKKVKHCTHIGMLMNTGFHDYLMSALKTEQTTTLNPDVAAMTEAQVESLIDNCNIYYEAFQSQKIVAEDH